MYKPKISRITHPSGAVHGAFKDFVNAHGEASWYQGDECFRTALEEPAIEPLLLLAVKGELLSDPGAHFLSKRPGSFGGQNEGVRGEEATKRLPANAITGSLLCVTVREPISRKGEKKQDPKPLKYPYRRSLIVGGPLLGDGTRLEKEVTMKSLLAAMERDLPAGVNYIRFCHVVDREDHKALFRQKGFRWSGEQLADRWGQADLRTLYDLAAIAGRSEGRKLPGDFGQSTKVLRPLHHHLLSRFAGGP